MPVVASAQLHIRVSKIMQASFEYTTGMIDLGCSFIYTSQNEPGKHGASERVFIPLPLEVMFA